MNSRYLRRIFSLALTLKSNWFLLLNLIACRRQIASFPFGSMHFLSLLFCTIIISRWDINRRNRVNREEKKENFTSHRYLFTMEDRRPICPSLFFFLADVFHFYEKSDPFKTLVRDQPLFEIYKILHFPERLLFLRFFSNSAGG